MLEVIVDESLRPRIGTELRNRGRKAVSLAQLDLRGTKDEPLIRTLAERPDPWVLLTADDELPRVCREVIEETNVTVATIHPIYPASYTQIQWHHDVAHRWAHVLGEQEQGTVRRYSLKAHRPWTPPRRKR